ncbi:hypothetical protein GmHk_14G040325 [Glycine max]|nr:hypothetical protein GmHk_14G040325 [Glycine max]
MEKEKAKDEILEYICGRHQMGPSTISIIFGPTGPLTDNVLILYQDMRPCTPPSSPAPTPPTSSTSTLPPLASPSPVPSPPTPASSTWPPLAPSRTPQRPNLLNLCNASNDADHGGGEEGEDELGGVLEEDHDDVTLADSEVGQSNNDLAGNEVRLGVGEGFGGRFSKQ